MSKKEKKYPVTEDIISNIYDLAENSGCQYLKYERGGSEITFEKGAYRISIYLSRMTIGVKTVVDGKEKNWFCKEVTFQDVHKVFIDPTTTLPKAYWQKKFEYKKKTRPNRQIIYNNSPGENPYF